MKVVVVKLDVVAGQYLPIEAAQNLVEFQGARGIVLVGWHVITRYRSLLSIGEAVSRCAFQKAMEYVYKSKYR